MPPYYTPPLYQPLQPLGTHLGTGLSLAPTDPTSDPSLLSSVGSRVLGGLGFVANVLDTPGSWVRNALIGENPFQGTFDFENRVSGRDVLEDWGALRPNTPGIDLGDVAGFGLELVTDPFSWMSGGLTKAGRVVRAAGQGDVLKPIRTAAGDMLMGSREAQMLDSIGNLTSRNPAAKAAIDTYAARKGIDLASIADDPLRASINFHLPFGQPLASATLPGALGRAQGLDKLGDALRFSGPGKMIAQAFSAPAGGEYEKALQVGSAKKRGLEDEFARTANDEFIRAFSDKEELYKAMSEKYGTKPEEWNSFYDRAVELSDLDPASAANATILNANTAYGQRFRDYKKIYDQLSSLGQDPLNRFTSSIGRVRKYLGDELNSLNSMGYGAQPLKDRFAEYWKRTAADYSKPGVPVGQSFAKTAAEHKRLDFLKDLPGGRDSINTMMVDSGDVNGTLGGLVQLHGNAALRKAAGVTQDDIMLQVSKHVGDNYVFLPGEKLKLNDRITNVGPELSQAKKARDAIEKLSVLNPTDPRIPVLQQTLDGSINSIRTFYANNGNPIPVNQGSDIVIDIATQNMDEWTKRLAQPDEVAKWIVGDELKKVRGKNFYADALSDLKKYGRETANKKARFKTLLEMFDNTGTRSFMDKNGKNVTVYGGIGQPYMAKEDGFTPLIDALGGTRFVTQGPKGGDSIFRPEVVEPLYEKIFGKPGPLTTPKDMRKALREVGVEDRLVDGLQEVKNRKKHSFATEKLFGLGRSASNFWKAGVTQFPAFFTRNLGSGQAGAFLDGMANPSFGPQKMAWQVLRGQNPEGLLDIPAITQRLADRGLPATAENAGLMLRELAYINGIMGSRPTQDALSHIAQQSGISENTLNEMPGANPQTFASIRDDWSKGSWKPWEQRGIGDRLNTDFKIGKLADSLNYEVEGLNRLSPFIQQISQGVDPVEAARRVSSLNVDYSARNFTPLENEYLKALFPFYSFTRGSLGHTLGDLAESPGGPLAQFIRFGETGREDDQIMPDYVGSGLALGLGSPAEGIDRYLTGFGMMHEDPLNMFQMGGDVLDTMKRTGAEILARTTPFVKTPVEIATGQQLFAQGRDIRDADPGLGRAITNVVEEFGGPKLDPGFLPLPVEALAGNIPYVGRLSSTVRKAADPRKGIWTSGLNTLTGVRITDVSPAAREAQTRELIYDELRQESGGKLFENVYVPKEVIQDMKQNNPQAYERTQRLMQLLSRLGQNAKARRAAAEDN